MLKNLKLLREERKLSQNALAEILGITQQSINKYENKSTEPDIETLIKIADYFHVSVDFLIGASEERHIIEQIHPTHLNNDELDVIEWYRTLESDKRIAVTDFIRILHDKKTII